MILKTCQSKGMTGSCLKASLKGITYGNTKWNLYINMKKLCLDNLCVWRIYVLGINDSIMVMFLLKYSYFTSYWSICTLNIMILLEIIQWVGWAGSG